MDVTLLRYTNLKQFLDAVEVYQLFYLAAKKCCFILFSQVLSEESKIGSARLKNATFVRVSDYCSALPIEPQLALLPICHRIIFIGVSSFKALKQVQYCCCYKRL